MEESVAVYWGRYGSLVVGGAAGTIYIGGGGEGAGSGDRRGCSQSACNRLL